MPSPPTRRTPRPQSNQQGLQRAAHGGERHACRFFSAEGFQHEKRVGHRGQRDVMMPARPRAAFEVIEAQFVFQLAVVLFDAPAAFRQADGAPEAERLARQVGEPVLDRRRRRARPLDEQVHRGAGQQAAATDAVRRPEGRQREARAERALGAGAPRDHAPRGGR